MSHRPLSPDQEWGLGPARTTPTVQALVANRAAEIAYTRTPHRLKRLGLPIHLGVKSVEEIAQRVGERVRQNPPRIEHRATRPLAAGVDGVMMPTNDGCREARCGVIYEPDWEAGRTPDECAGLNKEYVATLGSRESLVRAVVERVEQRRPTPTTNVAALADGAHWIREGYAKQLPHQVEILDFYHLCEHLGTVANAMHGAGTPQATNWRREMQRRLLKDGPTPLLSAMEAWKPRKQTAKKVKRQESGYFTVNQARMSYPEYVKQGLPIGSGAGEGACKAVVSERFKKGGMRWNIETAEPILHLRAALLTRPDLDLHPYVARFHARSATRI